MSKRLYLLMILFFIVAISGCNDGDEISGPSHVPSDAIVKMGGIFPFTGPLNPFGKPMHQAALLAVKHLNEAGFPVGWSVEDSNSNAEAGMEAAHLLVQKGQAQVIIGAAGSTVTIAIAENVSIPNQVPQISPSSTSPKMTTLAADENQDFLFRTIPSDDLQGAILARLAFGSLQHAVLPSSVQTGYKRVSVLYVDNDYGQGLNEFFTQNFYALGGEQVVSVPHAEVSEKDLENKSVLRDVLLPSLQQAYTGETEVLVAMSYPAYAEVFIEETIKNKWFDKFLFVDGTKSPDIIETVGATNLNGMCGTAPGSVSTESLDIFDASYRAEYGYVEEELPLFTSNTYDAVIIAGLAAYAAQAIGESVNSISIRNYLRSVADPDGQKAIAGPTGFKRAMKTLDAGLTINYQGASGEVNFDQHGDIVAPIEIWCFQNGKIVSQGLEQR